MQKSCLTCGGRVQKQQQRKRAQWGWWGMERTRLSGAGTPFQTAAWWHGTAAAGKHGTDTSSAHLSRPKGALGFSPPTEHRLTAPALPSPGVSRTRNCHRRITLRSSSGSMPDSSPLQPWLCLPRVLAAAQPPPSLPALGVLVPLARAGSSGAPAARGEHSGCATAVLTPLKTRPRRDMPVCHGPAGVCILTQGFSAHQKAPLSQHL